MNILKVLNEWVIVAKAQLNKCSINFSYFLECISSHMHTFSYFKPLKIQKPYTHSHTHTHTNTHTLCQKWGKEYIKSKNAKLQFLTTKRSSVILFLFLLLMLILNVFNVYFI